MSGGAEGLILLPLIIFPGLIPILLIGLLVSAFSSSNSGNNSYEQEERKRDEERKRIEERKKREEQQRRINSVSQSMGTFQSSMCRLIAEQDSENIKLSDSFHKELENKRDEILKVALKQDLDAFQDYVSEISENRAQTMEKIKEAQNNFNINYTEKISQNVKSARNQINEKFSEYLNEINNLRNDIETKNNKAKEISETYFTDAKKLLKSLKEDFNGIKYVPDELAVLEKQLNEAYNNYNKGLYEAVIAISKDAALNIIEEIYKADMKKHEWDNYYNLAIYLSEEIKRYTEAQAVISENVKNNSEKTVGKPFPNELIGIKIASYSDKDKNGQPLFDFLLNRINEIYNIIHGEQAKELSADQLKNYVNILNNDLYPAVTKCVNKSIINMNNAFLRQNFSEDIIDFFEEHNFSFMGFAYDDNSHDKALHLGLENHITGEELMVTLAPELIDENNIQTRVELNQTKGNETDEERKAFYRKSIENIVKEKNPYASVNLKCKPETRNKLSDNTEIKRKIKRQ